MRLFTLSLLVCTMLLQPGGAAARTIILTNDDGLTSNVVSVYRALKAQGHDVIVSVPCANQSGMGTAAYFGKPLAALTTACRNGAASIGDPGVGPVTRTDLPVNDFHYVAGTPVMATLYGLDVLARKRWGKAPDLVVSGPNEGQNVGAVILGSGTVSNAQFAAIKGIPAIALSAGGNSTGDETLANPVSPVVADRTAELVAELDRQAKGGRMLPSGIALNVNFPDSPANAPWKLTRIGTYNAYLVSFSDNMARDSSPAMVAMAKQHGASIPELPGIALDMNQAEPLPEQRNDESIVFRTAIAVSPMRAGYEGTATTGAKDQAMIARLLRGLFMAKTGK